VSRFEKESGDFSGRVEVKPALAVPFADKTVIIVLVRTPAGTYEPETCHEVFSDTPLSLVSFTYAKPQPDNIDLLPIVPDFIETTASILGQVINLTSPPPQPQLQFTFETEVSPNIAPVAAAPRPQNSSPRRVEGFYPSLETIAEAEEMSSAKSQVEP